MPATDDKPSPTLLSEPVGPPADGDSAAELARFDAFISYRRLPEDVAFVDHLQKALAVRGKNVWVDRAKIEPASDWFDRVARGIEAAKAFIFVITPESVVSDECRRELKIAAQRHKFIVPVVLRDVDRGQHLPEGLSRLNWIFFGPEHDDERALDRVTRALEEDLDWRDAHTRLGVRTKEWADSPGDGK
jgi:TIR domain